MKKEYKTPTIFKVVEVELEYGLLCGSVVDNIAGIETGGQEVGGVYDGSDPGSTFNHDWGN